MWNKLYSFSKQLKFWCFFKMTNANYCCAVSKAAVHIVYENSQFCTRMHYKSVNQNEPLPNTHERSIRMVFLTNMVMEYNLFSIAICIIAFIIDFLPLFWNIKLPRWIVWLVSTFNWRFEEGRDMTCFLSCAYEKHVVFYLNFWIKEVEIDYVCLFIFCKNTNNIISQG